MLHYLLRFRFPHFDPLIGPKVSAIPWGARSFMVHRQHTNTLAMLPVEQRQRFSERFALRSDERMLEAGPYLGFGTVRFATTVPEGRVVSAEPMGRNFEIADQNLRCNDVSNATLYRLAVGAFDGEGAIVDGGQQANSLVPGVVTGRRVDVEVVRIETLAGLAGIQPTLIVLTINGAELATVRRSRDYLASLSGVRLIAPGWYADSEGQTGPRLASALREIGYRVAVTPGNMVFAYRS